MLTIDTQCLRPTEPTRVISYGFLAGIGFLADANPPGRPSLFSLFPSPSYPSLIPLERMTSQFFISRARVWTCSGKSDTYRGDISHPVFLPWSHTASQLITLRTHLLGYHHCSRVKKTRKKPRKKIKPSSTDPSCYEYSICGISPPTYALAQPNARQSPHVLRCGRGSPPALSLGELVQPSDSMPEFGIFGSGGGQAARQPVQPYLTL